MTISRRTVTVTSLSIAGVVLVILAVFGVDRWVHSGNVLRSVEVAGVSLSGLDEVASTEALLAYEDALEELPAPFRIAGSSVDLNPTSVGFDLDESKAVEGALQVGREGSIFRQFGWWISHVFSSHDLEIEASLDESALNEVLSDWEEVYISDHPFAGDVLVVDGVPVASYPTPGTEIDRIGAADLILGSLRATDRPVLDLPTRAAPPPLTPAHVDAAVGLARRMLSAPVNLSRDDPEVEVVFDVQDLVEAMETEVVLDPSPQLVVGFSIEAVASKLEGLRDQLEAPPVDAELTIDAETDTVLIVPGRPGTIIDSELATLALEQAALSVSRRGEMPFEDGAAPAVTTEDLESLGIAGLVSEATTGHPCCQPRVENIHLFADIVDGTIVLPGETLSLNVLVGERTTERGFLPAPTIIRGKIVDTVGGGVSQFATTFYNAVFWGGYEDVTHSPHSYYFSRYPEGIEATISWPLPNLEFRNDSDAAVLIKTEYDDTNITVKFYGDNGGLIVDGSVSDRYNFTEPTIDYSTLR